MTTARQSISWMDIMTVLRGVSSVLFTLALLVTTVGCTSQSGVARGEDSFTTSGGVAYDVVLDDVPSDELRNILQRSLRLYTLSERPPGSPARLQRRAEADVGTTKKVLRSEGYYDSDVAFALQEGAANVIVTLQIQAGQQFRIGEFELQVQAAGQGADNYAQSGLTLPGADAFGLANGDAARASAIVRVEAEAVRWLQDRGFAAARLGERDASVNLTAQRFDIVSSSRAQGQAPAMLAGRRSVLN